MRVALAVALLALAMAGCSGQAPRADPADAIAGPRIEGWVVDEAIVPVVGATVRLAGHDLAVATDAEGHYVLDAPAGLDAVLTLEAPGFVPQSRAVSALAGARLVLNVTLVRVPAADPFEVVEQFEGVLRCGAVATLMEDPGRPHEHQGVRCSQLLNDTGNRWDYALPTGSTGVVFEVVWDPQSDVALAMVLRIVSSSGEVFGFIEGQSVLRLQVSQTKLAQEVAAGHDVLAVTLEPGAGTGNHEHGAVGGFVQQPFRVFATAFFNGPVPPAYSVADP